MPDENSLLPFVRKQFESDPAAAARSLETMTEQEAVGVLGALPPTLAAKALRQLQVGYAAALLKDAGPELFQEVARDVESEHAAAIFMALPNDTREQFLAHLPAKLKREVQELLTYPVGSVGRIMRTNFLAFHTDVKVADAIEKIRSLVKQRVPLSYVYVIDQKDHLVGVMNMRDLMLASPEATVESIMRRDVFTLNAFTDREEAAKELAKRRYFAAPVVDGENRILGIVKGEQLIEEMQEEATEDIQRMFGAGGDERAFSSVGFSLKKRLPWLHVNLGTAFLAAGVVAFFEEIIAKITILAVFLPVVAGQGGNAGAQSLAIVMRGLVMREIPKEKRWSLVWKEAWLGAITGTVTGIVTALVAWLWHGNPFLGIVIGLGMIVNLFFAGLSGAAIPIGMKSLGLDPAQCSSIILTTVTDVVGFFAFLGFAVVFQNYLV